MATDHKDRSVDTTDKTKNDSQARIPSERDESPQGSQAPRGIMQQAASDIERGLVDTDLHGDQGVEAVKPAAPKSAVPQENNHEGQRHAAKSDTP